MTRFTLRTEFLLVGSIALIAASVSANVVLMRQNSALRSGVLSLRSQLDIPLNVPLPPLSGTSLLGKPQTVNLNAGHSQAPAMNKVLFVLSPMCKFCAANWKHWRDLLKIRNGNSSWQPIFLNVGPPLDAGFIQRHEIETLPVFQTVSADTMLNYRMYATPQTIVVDSLGRARGIWKGVLNSTQISEIHQLLSDSRTSRTPSSPIRD